MSTYVQLRHCLMLHVLHIKKEASQIKKKESIGEEYVER